MNEERIVGLEKDITYWRELKDQNISHTKYALELSKKIRNMKTELQKCEIYLIECEEKYEEEHVVKIKPDEQFTVAKDKYEMLMNYKSSDEKVGSEEESLIVLRLMWQVLLGGDLEN
jgi:hypothetical protein